MSAVATLEPSLATMAMRTSSLAALRKLTIRETDLEVLIQGTVSSYYLKQLAQETVMPLLAGRILRNRVSVVRN